MHLCDSVETALFFTACCVVQDKNSQLNRSVREMSGTLEELEGRERELVGVLNEKSAEIESMNAELLMLNENSQQQATQIKVRVW